MITKEEAEKAYQQLVVERQKNPPIKTKHGEVEVHHILPSGCGGLDVPENKVALYAKEHFMAHVYLWIIHRDDEFHYQTMCALNQMVKGTINGSRLELREFILQSEEYQKAREEFAQYTSEILKIANTGSNSHSFGKHWYYDPITLSSNQYFDSEIPNKWLLGRKFKNPDQFSEKISRNNKDSIWIHKKDLSQQKHIKRDIAEEFLKTDEWELGHLPYSEAQKQQQRLKTLETQLRNGTRTQISEEKKHYQFCFNCGKENLNKFVRCCCDECNNEYIKKLLYERKLQRYLKNIQLVEEQGYFDAQTNKTYNGVVNRGQVRRYLEATNHHCCNSCKKSDVKLIVHAIDGNCKNLIVTNYEFLCRECYLKSGTAGFSGRSMKECIYNKLKHDL